MKQTLLMNAGLNFLFFLLFFFLLIQSLKESGFSLLTLLTALIASYDFVQATRHFMVYWNIRKGGK